MAEHDRRTDVTPEKVVELYKEHKNKEVVAEILECSNTVVSHRLEKAGFEEYSHEERKERKLKEEKRKNARKLPAFKSREERLQYMREHQREPLMHFLAEIAEKVRS